MKGLRLIVAVIGVLLLALPFAAAAEEVAIVVNPKNPVGDIDAARIRSAYLKEQANWPNGDLVRSVDVRANTPERKAFLEKVLKMSAAELEQYWITTRYVKGVPVPPKLASDQEVIEYVIAFEGAIGFVNAKSIDSAKRSQIRIVYTIPVP